MASTPPPLERYVRKEYTGQSIFSDVYRAEDTLTHAVVAMKVTIPDELRPPHDSLKELSILQQLKKERVKRGWKQGDSGVIEVMQGWTEEDETMDEVMLTVVLPFLGHDLNSVLETYRRPVKDKEPAARDQSPAAAAAAAMGSSPFEGSDGGDSAVDENYINVMPASRARAIMYQLTSALEFVHSQGIIHRDIKPQNVLFESLDSECKLTLIDFDISWVPPDNRGQEPADDKITDVGSGTYRAPELLFGVGNYGTSLDIWSLGVIAVQLFAERGNRHPVFYNDNSKYSDIALIGTIFGLLGVPTAETWPEVRDVPSFQHMAFKPEREPMTWAEMAPLAPDSLTEEVLPKMLCFSGAKRMTATEILASSYFKNER